MFNRLECLLDVDVNCATAARGGWLDGFVDTVVDMARANRKEIEANRTAVRMECRRLMALTIRHSVDQDNGGTFRSDK
jgi:hypothetical protein